MEQVSCLVIFPKRQKGKECIVDVEFQTSTDPDLASRLLVYNAVLHHEYHVSVISLVIYPFKTTVAGSPLIISQLPHGWKPGACV